MSGDKNQFSILYATLGPFEIVVEVYWFVVFVDAEESNVEVITRIGKIVGVAAEECGVKFRSEHQTHVRVLLVFVEMKHIAGVERYHVAPQATRGSAIFFDRAHR